MDETRFWQLIGAADSEGEDATLERLEAALGKLSKQELVGFQVRFDHLHGLAGRSDLWAAAVLLNSGYCSDDGFTDFRSWLISRGQAVYEAALKAPDSLARIAVESDEDGPRAQFESFGYLAAEAWEARGLDEDEFLDAVDEARFDDDSDEDISDPDFDDGVCSDAALQRRLPALWAQYGRFKQASDRRAADEPQHDPGTLLLEGLGAIQNGSRVEHKTFGIGTIADLSAVPGGMAMANIWFGEQRRPMLVDPRSGLWRLAPTT